MSAPSASLSPPSFLLSRLRRAAHFAYGLAALIGTAALWGWAIGLPRLRDLGIDFAPMAPAEALAFVLLGASLRVLRFDVAAPLLGLSAPGAVAALLAAFALAAARPSPWLVDTLSSRRTGAVVTRWLLPAAFFVPMTIGWIRLFAEREGLFSEA